MYNEQARKAETEESITESFVDSALTLWKRAFSIAPVLEVVREAERGTANCQSRDPQYSKPGCQLAHELFPGESFARARFGLTTIVCFENAASLLSQLQVGKISHAARLANFQAEEIYGTKSVFNSSVLMQTLVSKAELRILKLRVRPLPQPGTLLQLGMPELS